MEKKYSKKWEQQIRERGAGRVVEEASFGITKNKLREKRKNKLSKTIPLANF